MEFRFNEKVSSRDFPLLINNNWQEIVKNNSEIVFDLVKLEWITGEAITYLFALINFLKSNDIKLKVILPNPGNLLNTKNGDKNKRNRHKRLASLIDIWEIENSCNLSLGNEIIVPSDHNTLIEKSRRKYKHIDSSWYRILPFKKIKTPLFENVNNIREHLDDKLQEIYKIEKETLLILNKFNSNKPFENQTLSHLLTTELFLNTIFHSQAKECYFSITLNSKFNEDIEKEKFLNQGFSEIEATTRAKSKVKWLTNNILPKSIIEERDGEISSFFKQDESYINRTFLEFSYIDFGIGIPKSLKNEFDTFKKNLTKLKKISPAKYREQRKKLSLQGDEFVNEDTKILEYAFLLDSSREPFEESLEIKDYMPRGLYFIIEVIKRFEGLLIIRSNKGKLIYDFSESKEKNRAIIPGKIDYNFPGTMLTILLPSESKNGNSIDNTEGAIELENFKGRRVANKIRHSHLSIGQILSDAFKRIDNNIDRSKINITLYNELFKGLNKRLKSENEDKEKRIIYIDFAGVNLSFIESKIFFYLVNTPYINENHTNVVILNISNDYVNRLQEIQELIRNTKPFHFRPIPCIIHTKDKGLEILWIGVSNKPDEKKLTELLMSPPEMDFVPISDIKNPDLIYGNLFRVNWISRKSNSGNVFLNYFPDFNEIKYESCFRVSSRLSENIKKFNLVWLHNKEIAYLTSGGKYQYQFLNFIELLATFRKDRTTLYSKQIARYLVNKWLFDIKELPIRIDWIVSVTLSGQILAREILNELKVFYKDSKYTPELIRLAHYYEFENEEYGLGSISEFDKVIIVTDVISTGDLLKRLIKSIEHRKANVIRHLSIADVRDIEKYYDPKIDSILTSLMLPKDFDADKDFDFNQYDTIKDYHKEVIRINPIINAPASKKLEGRKNINQNVLFGFKKFIQKYIDDEYLLIGYFKNNNTFHSYFFDTNNYFKSKLGKQFFAELIKKCSTLIKDKKHSVVAFPIFSGIENINEFYLKEILFENNLIYDDSIIIPLPRVDTPNGWRFSFPPESLSPIIHGNILLIDDGSLSGETIIQMIDSISFFSVSSITLISIFGRLRDFQKEFFSQIIGLTNVSNGIHVFFGIHAHIPFYPFNKSFPLNQEYNELRNINLKEVKIEEEHKYVAERIREIKTEPINSRKSNNHEILNYFPINNKGEIDRKKIYMIRDAIGKLEHYRLYKEYYSDFSIDEEEYEILLAIILHEPSLISIVKNLLPEIYRKLKTMVKLHVIENKKNEFRYQWRDESLVRLMFILDKDEFYNKETIISLARSTINNDYLQGFLIHEYKKVLDRNDTFSLLLKNKLYSTSTILAKDDLFDNSYLKPLLRNFESQKYDNVRGAIEKLKDTIFKEQILPRHRKFVLAKGSLHANLKNINRPIDRDKIKAMANIIEEELLDPLYRIQKCENFFPDKNIIFTGSNSTLFRIRSLYSKLNNIENTPSDRITLAQEIKDFVDNFAKGHNDLKEFLSQYPTDIKDCISKNAKSDKYNVNINFNLDKLIKCKTVLPIHAFYFGLIIKEIFNNIIEEFSSTRVELSYIFDDNSFTIIQNKPFNEKNKKNGGLFYIKSIIELYGGLFEEFKNINYKMKFNFSNIKI